MRILIVSDIHGNWPALAAIQEPHDVYLCLGDLVDYGPDPAPCVRWAMDHAHNAIRGNHDQGVAQGVPVAGEDGYRYLTRVSRPWMWDALGLDERRYLLQLQVTRRMTLGSKRFLMVHAPPRDPLDEYLLQDPKTWAKRVHNVEADIVCVGHSHIQFDLTAERVVAISPDSVGQSRDGDPCAAYAILDDNKYELKRVEYPVEETIARIEASPVPERAKQSRCLGRLPVPAPGAGAEPGAEDVA